jgi:L-rhamnose-H+ transport protein
MGLSFVFGTIYGIGGTAFGLAIRAIGFSLTYAIAIGISSVLGTMVPPLVRGELDAIFSQAGSHFIILGLIAGVVGIAVTGKAGRMKDLEISADAVPARKNGFHLWKGLLLAGLAGVLSAVYGFALEAGAPIAAVAASHGAGHFQGNVIYIFSNSGAFLTTLVYCLFLHRKEDTFGEFMLPAGDTAKPSLKFNYMLAILTGFLWFGQFFFYNLGHVRMGAYKFTSWAIHMTMLVLFSSLVGLVLREWRDCGRATKAVLALAIALLISAVLLIAHGNQVAMAFASDTAP